MFHHLDEAIAFESFLDPRVVRALVDEFADMSRGGESLTWKFDDDAFKGHSSRAVGVYSHSRMTMFVSQKRTRDKFKQQVTTILHEIRHWNQHVRLADEEGVSVETAIPLFTRLYSGYGRAHGYWNNPMEVDARRFADANVDRAMKVISAVHGGRTVNSDYDAAIDELLDIAGDRPENAVTRRDVIESLNAFNAMTPELLRRAIGDLSSAGVTFR